VAQVVVWGKRDPAAQHTQKTLSKLWKVSQPAVSQALAFLVRQGYVVPLPRTGTDPRAYLLTGMSRLIFG